MMPGDLVIVKPWTSWAVLKRKTPEPANGSKASAVSMGTFKGEHLALYVACHSTKHFGDYHLVIIDGTYAWIAGYDAEFKSTQDEYLST